MGSNKTYNIHILLLYIVLTICLTYPTVMNLNSGVPGDGVDASLFVWNLWWMKYALLELHQNPFYSDYIFSPIGVPLVFHTYTPLYGFLSIPIQLFSSPVFCYNFIFLCTYVFTAWATFLLARLYGLGIVPAFIAGFVYAFCPTRTIRSLGHLNLLSTQWIPLFFFVFHQALHSDKKRYGVAAGFFLFAAFTTSYQIFVMLSLMLGIALAFILIQSIIQSMKTDERSNQNSEQNLGLLFDRKALQNFILMLLVVLVLISPLLIQALNELRWEGNYIQENVPSEGFKSDLMFYLNPYERINFFKKVGWIFQAGYFKGTEKFLSPGFIALLLALIGFPFLVSSRIDKLWFKIWGIVFLVFFTLSLGSSLIISGNDTEYWLPYKFFRTIPLLNGIRVPGRFSLGVAFSIALFAGLGAHMLWIRKNIICQGLLLILSLMMIVESVSLPYPIDYIKRDTSSEDSSSSPEKRETRGRILQIPYGLESGFRPIGKHVTRQYLLQQVFHNRGITGGMVARCPYEVLEYFNLNPFLHRINELQSSRFNSALNIRPEVMKQITDKWVQISQLDEVILYRKPIQGVSLNRSEFFSLLTFLNENLPLKRVSKSPDKVVFTLKRRTTPIRSIDFQHQPANDLFIYNHVLLGNPTKFSPREYIRAFYKLKILLPLTTVRPQKITLRYRGFVKNPGRQATLSLYINRTWISDLPYTDNWRVETVKVPQKILKEGLNMLLLSFNEENVSPSQSQRLDQLPCSIATISAGFHYNNHGDARLIIAGKNYSKNTRGFNAVIINPSNGKVLSSDSFDTCGFESENDRFAKILEKLEPGMIVAAAVKDDASVKITKRLQGALYTIGGSISLKKKFRYAYSIIGVKGWKPGQAVEAMHENIVTLTVGNGEIGLSSITLDD
ncbi:interleukin-like EMT inducer domain-containing protein [candidate division CSSED10-310 bacterium]|uniref:Interleukin-like EMT inducer domain-containing protein n=1 Tax=candidate division CSSED10-310 bacterium TaxID=2855610 RepID=A0ABV6Z1A6_UNCC1